jgi:hypothetical protein
MKTATGARVNRGQIGWRGRRGPEGEGLLLPTDGVTQPLRRVRTAR